MSIGAVSSNPWANPYLYTGSSSSAASSAGSSGTTGTDAIPDFSVAESQGSSSTTSGTSTTSGSTLGLGSLLADFQNWLLQMQMQSGTTGNAMAASGTGGTTSGSGDEGTSQTASASGANGHHGDQRNQAMSLLRNIDTQLTSINSELQGTGAASQAG